MSKSQRWSPENDEFQSTRQNKRQSKPRYVTDFEFEPRKKTKEPKGGLTRRTVNEYRV